MIPDKDEMERWGFFLYENNTVFQNALCMGFKSGARSRYQLIRALYNHGVDNGKREAQYNMQKSIGFNADEITEGLKRLERKLLERTDDFFAINNLEPCPFCSANNWVNLDGASSWKRLSHKHDCFFTNDTTLSPSQFESWNTRALSESEVTDEPL